jgi:hypothetical protein
MVDCVTSARQEAADYYGVGQEDVAPVPLAPLCRGEEDGSPCMRLEGHKGPHRSRAFIDRSEHPLKWDVREPNGY